MPPPPHHTTPHQTACDSNATLALLAKGGIGGGGAAKRVGGASKGSEDGARGGAGRAPPLQQFVELERRTAGAVLSLVHAAFSAIAGVIAGSAVLTPLIVANARDLMAGRVPDEWLDVWEAGGEEPSRWLDAAIRRARALSDWETLFRGGEATFLPKLKTNALDLGELFNPATFLNSLKQQSSRRLRCSMDSLTLSCSWNAHDSMFGSESIPVSLAGLLLQGAHDALRARLVCARAQARVPSRSRCYAAARQLLLLLLHLARLTRFLSRARSLYPNRCIILRRHARRSRCRGRRDVRDASVPHRIRSRKEEFEAIGGHAHCAALRHCGAGTNSRAPQGTFIREREVRDIGHGAHPRLLVTHLVCRHLEGQQTAPVHRTTSEEKQEPHRLLYLVKN